MGRGGWSIKREGKIIFTYFVLLKIHIKVLRTGNIALSVIILLDLSVSYKRHSIHITS